MIDYKWNIIICILIAFMLSGCNLPGTQSNNRNNEVMEGLDKNLVVREEDDDSGAERKTDDFSTEVRHWKYGNQQPAAPAAPVSPAQPYYPRTPDSEIDDGKIVSMQFLTVQDLDRIQEVLIQQGFLNAKTHDQNKFNQAVAKFQEAHQIQSTGELDSGTITLICQETPNDANKSQ